MESKYWPVIRKAYDGFNSWDIDSTFSVMDANVHWLKVFEGSHVVVSRKLGFAGSGSGRK